jgi:hypothetical protein
VLEIIAKKGVPEPERLSGRADIRTEFNGCDYVLLEQCVQIGRKADTGLRQARFNGGKVLELIGVA